MGRPLSDSTRIKREIASLLEIGEGDVAVSDRGVVDIIDVHSLTGSDIIQIAIIIGCQTRELKVAPHNNGFSFRKMK
jgi:hypothetical protein